MVPVFTFPVGATNATIYVPILSLAGGILAAGLTATDLESEYSGPELGPTTITLADGFSASDLWSSGNILDMGSGVYRLDLPNAMFAAARTLVVSVYDTTYEKVGNAVIQVVPRQILSRR